MTNQNPTSKSFLTLQEFTKFLEIIKSHQEKEEQLAESLKYLVDGWPIITFAHGLEGALIALLEQCMKDSSETISYYIYEADWGKRSKEFYIQHPDGTQHHLYTIKDLYTYLVNHNE
jgi:uncharacterized membrane protein